MEYVWLGLTIFMSVLAALLVYMMVDRKVGSRKEEEDEWPSEPLSPAVGFAVSREDWTMGEDERAIP